MTNQDLFTCVFNNNYNAFFSHLLNLKDTFIHSVKRKYSFASFLDANDLSTAYDEACIKVYDKIESGLLQPEKLYMPLNAFVYGMAVNYGRKMATNKGKHGKLHTDIANKDFIDETLSQLDKLIENEELDYLYKCLSKLKERDRNVIHDYYLEGISPNELVKKYNFSSIGSFYVTLNRIVSKLRQMFIDDGKDLF